jgi:hypothetical protein
MSDIGGSYDCCVKDGSEQRKNRDQVPKETRDMGAPDHRLSTIREAIHRPYAV